jgi:hypothetical protein
MLEQAIIDASALKEAAIKNAEQEVLEKYSRDIKEAVNALLEVEEEEDLLGDELGMEEDPLAGELEGEPEGEVDPVVAGTPLAATAGEKLCPCPTDGDTVTIDLPGLLALPADAETGEPLGHDALAGELGAEEELLAPPEEEEEEEEIELQESELYDLVEKLVFDYETTPAGYSSGAPVSELELEQEAQRVAREIADAQKENENLKEGLDGAQKENNKFRRIILQLKDKLDEVTASNARLLYTNRVLGDDSLNERQKTKIAETISKAQTIEEAKTIYEALQSAVDGTIPKKAPKSLNEAVSRQSSMVFSRSGRSEKAISDPMLERMQRLAGIKN